MAIDTGLEQPGGPQTRPNRPSEGTPHGGPPGPPGVNAEHFRAPEAPASGLAPGVHPNDPSGTERFAEAQEAPASHVRVRRAPFSIPSGEAMPVFQRSAHDWRSGVVGVNTNNGGTAGVVGRLAGRRSLTLWIPTKVVVGGSLVTTTDGVMYAATEGELQNGGGTYLGLGDSVTIEAEASVTIGLAPGSTQGYVQYLDLFDAPGGGISGNT
jgi:hypothetical protein